jgi:hypothetical protein
MRLTPGVDDGVETKHRIGDTLGSEVIRELCIFIIYEKDEWTSGVVV